MAYGKILLIEKDKALRELVAAYLSKDGMECILSQSVDDTALNAALKASVIILSSSQDDNPCDSITALRDGRYTPLIVITDICEYEDKIMYLRLGADDVISKPFDITELTLKIRAIIRRCKGAENTASDRQICGGLTVDISSYEVTVDGKEVQLSPKEIEMLFLMMSHPEYTFSRAELSSRVWGKVLSDTRTIAVHINRIKKKLGEYADNIVSVRGVGYKFTKNKKGN